MSYLLSPGVCTNMQCNGSCSCCHPERYWNWGYFTASTELLRDLQDVWPGLFNIMSEVESPLFGTTTVQFRCAQLPHDLIGQHVTFNIDRNVADGSAIINFKNVLVSGRT